MPHRLRSPSFLYGLPELEGRDLDTARIGNFQIRQAVRLIKLSMASGRSGYLENPATSRAWLVLTRMLSRELVSGKCRIIVVDMCGYGTAFKKPTRLLIWGKYASRVELRRCNGKRSLCSHSGVPHLQLTGVQNGFVLLITLRCIARSSWIICWVSYFLDVGHYSFGVGALQIRATLCKAVFLLTLQRMARLDGRISA